MKNKDLITIFVNSIGSNSNYTKDSYEYVVTMFMDNVKCEVADVTYEKYILYKSSLNTFSVATQRKYMSITKEFLEWCFTNYNIGNSNELFRISKLKAPKGNSKVTQPFTADEVNEMISHGKNDRDKAIIALGCVTGLRVAEIINLKLSDIKDGYIEVYGKGNKYRTVYPNKLASEMLEKYINGMREKKVKEKNIKLTNVFISNCGTPMLETSINRTLKVIAKRADINKDVHPHTLRHTCATLMYENGIDIEDIQLNHGHASVSTTNRYIHANVNLMKKKLATIDLLG
jgi:integrase/recombinase XerD